LSRTALRGVKAGTVRVLAARPPACYSARTGVRHRWPAPVPSTTALVGRRRPNPRPYHPSPVTRPPSPARGGCRGHARSVGAHRAL